ncbi:twin-arginine translocase TatA/TatE family subunit [Marinimicrobium alkaliphilum]|uniref:twin-arginine translocase TatA/TatE family subunit n=1 Tax=Marinimicrobium alkaliphilum TaxID=2202654 RepID=UPI000DBA1A71|nr:twin-arginine translocase TatA/TatE family subunit [Marinimicrobium alkaliphilum]
MGISGIGVWQLVIILIIIVLLFGTKRLRHIGGDLGSAIKSFKKSVTDGDDKKDEEDPQNVEHQEGESATSETKAEQKSEQK